MITKIESMLDKELANIQKNEDVCSDISGNQKSNILEDRILTDKCSPGWFLGYTKSVKW